MRLKKVAKILLSCVLAGALFTGCGGDKPADNSEKPAETSLGMITRLNITEQKIGELIDELKESDGVKISKHVPKFYDNLKLLQMGIESGNVNEISVYKSVADYLLAANDKFEIVKDNSLGKLSDYFCFAVRKDDVQLKDELNQAIDQMKADGTLDKFIDEYITNAKSDNIPAVEIPAIEGAQTLKIGVTGDLPPLDFVTADGKPAGFNTAMLAEISRRINRNVEIINIDSGARASALSSNIIDVVFWAIVPFGKKIPSDIDKPEGLELSEPYFKDDVVHLKLKK